MCYRRLVEDSMRRSQVRLELLLRDYDQSREDERQGSAAFSNMLAAALASAFAALLILYQRPNRPDETVGFWISIISPVAILLPTVYAGLLGAISTARSYYLRVLEREISVEMRKLCGDDSLDLVYSERLKFPAFSSVTFATVRASPKRGKGPSAWYLAFVAVVFTAANVMMLNIAYAAMLTVSSWWANVYFFAYVVVIAMLAKLVYDIGLNGRAYFEATAEEVKKKRAAGFEQPENPYDAYRQQVEKCKSFAFEVKDTLGFFPKPDDLIKVSYEIVGALLAFLYLHARIEVGLSPRRVLVLVVFLIFFEGFVYQTRYIANDILGASEEGLLASRDRRGRITSEGDLFVASRHLVLRMLGIVVATIPIYYSGLLKVYGISLGVLFVITVCYERARHRLGRTKFGSPSQKSVSGIVFLLVCVGGPLRMLVGFFAYLSLFIDQWTVVCAWQFSSTSIGVVCVGVAFEVSGVVILLTLWGVMVALVSVSLTWVLEALCEVKSYGQSTLYTEWKAEGKRHAFYALRTLFSPLGVHVTDKGGEAAQLIAGELSPRRAFAFVDHNRKPWVWRYMHWMLTPWTVASVLAVPLGVLISSCVFKVFVPAFVVVLLMLVALALVVFLQDGYFFKSDAFMALIVVEPLGVFVGLWAMCSYVTWQFLVVSSMLSFLGGVFWLFYLSLQYSDTRHVFRRLVVGVSTLDQLLALKVTDWVLGKKCNQASRDEGTEEIRSR